MRIMGWWWQSMFDSYPTLRQVIVNTKTNQAFRGVLWRRRRGYLLLRQAVMLQGNEARTVDGEVLIPVANVDFIQVLR